MAHNVSGSGLNFLGAPLMNGRNEFRQWAKETIENGEGRMVRYDYAVQCWKVGLLVEHGNFAGMTILFATDPTMEGIVVIDGAWMEAYRFYGLTNAEEVRLWAEELGLHPRLVA